MTPSEWPVQEFPVITGSIESIISFPDDVRVVKEEKGIVDRVAKIFTPIEVTVEGEVIQFNMRSQLRLSNGVKPMSSESACKAHIAWLYACHGSTDPEKYGEKLKVKINRKGVVTVGKERKIGKLEDVKWPETDQTLAEMAKKLAGRVEKRKKKSRSKPPSSEVLSKPAEEKKDQQLLAAPKAVDPRGGHEKVETGQALNKRSENAEKEKVEKAVAMSATKESKVRPISYSGPAIVATVVACAAIALFASILDSAKG